MELYCDLEVHDRIVYPNVRRVKAVSCPALIALGRLPIAIRPLCEEPGFGVAVFTPQNSSGTLYNVCVLREICTKFAAKGKATLRFECPAHDLRIKSYPLELEAFLEALKSLKEESLKEGTGGETLSPVQPLPSSSSETEPTTTRHGDSPATISFPSSLRILRASDSGLLRIDSQILALKQLQCLEIRRNALVDVPPALCELSKLTELSINGNYLETLPAELFSEGMFPALVTLNLSENYFTSLPPGISTLSKLQTLYLDGNGLEQLPSDIGDLSELTYFSMSENALQFLPGSFIRLHLEVLVVSGNPFEERFQPFALEHASPTLQELSARTILKHKLRVQDDDIPRCLNEYLKTQMKCSLCGSVFLKPLVEVVCEFDLRAIAHHGDFPLDLQGDYRVKVPFSFKLCSTNCCVALHAELESLP